VGNDYLFSHGRGESSIAIETFARAVDVPATALKECLSTKADELLKADLDEGAKLEIDGTPTFIIRGEKFTGELPEKVLLEYPL
jgi:protein-disulfide isomerase